ncbi:MAG TPA: hypothetical protein DD670_15750 [Planctomycetaceae bacterium]|nr:hypothetical protein [Planctomycetaceae bacterium]
MATPESASPSLVYRVKITLDDFRPPIWRCVEVEDCSLELLHDVVQDAMGWHNYHLYEFRIADEAYSNPRTLEDDQRSAAELTLGELVARQLTQFEYVYDFGDNWSHVVEIEPIGPAQEQTHYPRCVGGERACPPEDCGGSERYARFLKALDNPDDPAFDDACDVLGETFVPTVFDPERVTRRWLTWNFADPDSGPTFEDEVAADAEPEPPKRNKTAAQTKAVERQPQAAKNDPCPCGSGKKFKKCCMKRGKDEFEDV